MMKQVISTSKAPKAIGPYNQAIKSGNMLFVSGQLGIDPETDDFVAGSIKEQTEQIFKNLTAILEEAGMSVNDIVKTTVFLTDMTNFTIMNEVYSLHLSEPFPARSTIAVRALPKHALVEIEVIAVDNK